MRQAPARARARPSRINGLLRVEIAAVVTIVLLEASQLLRAS
jgi:hypothetical protein